MKDLNEFKEWMQLQNLADGTIENYLYEISKLPEDQEKQRSYLVNNRHKIGLIAAWRKHLRFQKHQGKINTEKLYDQLETFKMPKRRGITESEKAGRAFPKEQWGDIISKAPNRCAKMGIYIGFQTGLRLSEILNLRVQDVDLKKNIIHVRSRKEDLKNGVKSWDPKNFKERDIPLTRHQANIMRQWIQERLRSLKHPYLLWTGRSFNKVSNRSFQRWCKVAHPKLKPHDLRRSYATALYYSSEKDVKIVQLALGHANVAVTSQYLRLESKEYMEKIRKAME